MSDIMEIKMIMKKAEDWGIKLTKEKALLFQQYHKLLIAENARVNLTRIISPEEVLEEHFIDSLAGFIKGRAYSAGEFLDLGSGAGFPGIPLKIFSPQLKLDIIEASKKKLSFLSFLVQELKLTDVRLMHTRAEDYGRGAGRETYPWITARALAPLVTAAELALPLLKIGGFFWAYKGPSADQELSEAEEIISHCGGRLVHRIDYSLPRSLKSRTILIIKKTASCESRFPRKAGIPQKRPYLKKMIKAGE